MKFLSHFALFVGATVAQKLCGQYESASAGGYTVYNNLYNERAGVGSQCTTVSSVGAGGASWSTTWSWSGSPSNVKSYANTGISFTKKPVSQVNTIPTSASWSYSGPEIRANVAYDLFTAKDINHVTYSGDYELMVWLAHYGDVGPLGQNVGQVQVGGQSWTLYDGFNGNCHVYSFVAVNSPVHSYSGDIQGFFTWLEKNKAFPASTQNLIALGFGTETFTGSDDTFTCNHFTARVS